MARDWMHYAAEGILRDGTSVHLRAIRPDDRERLASAFAQLSPESVYLRFFRAKQRLTETELTSFTELDFRQRVGLFATLRHDGQERIVGVARYAAGDPPTRAEVAFTVGDAFQGRGVGTLLLEHLVLIARHNGITEFEAEVLGENNRMLRMFAHSGFRVTRALDSGVFHVSFPTEETPAHQEANDRRERAAAAESVRPILAPRSVAVVGASRRPGSLGHALLTNLRTCGFTGTIHPVNPATEELQGLRSHPTVRTIGTPVDLAVIAVPAAQVEVVVRDCADAGVRAVIVVSSGFGEASEAGREAQERLVALARGSGMRLVGPNCMGVLNTDPAVSLHATFAPTRPLAGHVAMLSQSGALGLAILDHVRALNLGISSFVSVGNKADVSSNDLLAYWADDPRTRVILLYLESFGNPGKFARIAPDVSRDKPIVAVKSGRSAAGTRATRSHSSALADLDVAVDALFEHAGVIRTETLEGMFDVAMLLSTQPVPPGSRVGVVTNAGGPGVLLADACEARGLTLPALGGGRANPVDLTPMATAAQYERAIADVGTDAAVDSVVVLYVPPMVTRPETIAAAIARGAAAVPAEKPVLTVFLSARGAPAVLGDGPRGPLPSYSYPENAARALAAAEGWGRWRQRPRGRAVTLERFARDAIRAVVDRVLARTPGPVWLDVDDLASILRAAGIESAETITTTPARALDVAPRLGYPLVAKAVVPGLLHKSDIGGVLLGLHSPDVLAAGLATLERRMRAAGHTFDAVLLQREVPDGIEALVGVTTDDTFGPLVVCGLGGVLVELLRDVGYRLPPVTDVDAADMLARLRATRLLDGWRGGPAGDRVALVDVIQRVSALVEVVPELRELDLNPVKVLAPGAGCVVVDGRMRIGPR
jgi:acyl-CoA synthetase (NDP forming)/RimJ/RimL family protein N-acetyltransferase